MNAVLDLAEVPVLSVQDPWATWIAAGIKPVENREWAARYRGPLWIHRSRTWDRGAYAFARRIGATVPTVTGMGPGAILALVDLIDICHGPADDGQCGSKWAVPGLHHWQLRLRHRLATPVPAKGQLGLWLPDPQLIERLATALTQAVGGGGRG